MSGRDFKVFLSSHQKQIGQQDSRLVTRFLSGHKPTFKPVDYEKIQLLTQIKKSSAKNALSKIQQLEKTSKKNKEVLILHEHRRVWEIEMRKLREAEERVSYEINLLRPPSPNLERSTSSKEEVYEEINDFADHLHYNLKEFVKSTVDPIKMLRDDLTLWMISNKHRLQLGHHNVKQEREIMKTVKSVKEQQKTILLQLQEEQDQIEWEFQPRNLYDDVDNIDKRRPNSAASTISNLTSTSSFYGPFGNLPAISLGPPSHLFGLYCPDKVLAENCLLEFDVLDERFSMELESLEEKYKDVINNMPNNGWTDEDCMRFRHVINQYNSVPNKRRQLYLHRLKIEFPHKSSSQIKSFEDFASRHKNLQKRMKALLAAWRRDKEDLSLHVASIFHEASLAYKKKQKEMIKHTKQKFVCNFLREKLNDFREERLELMRLEAEEQTLREEEESNKRSVKESKEKKKRELDKHMIQDFKERQSIQTAQLKELNRLRMLELKEKHAMQRAHDMERVEYRNELHHEKLEEQKRAKDQLEIEKLEKDIRLNRITDHINSNMKEDPNRLFEHTMTTLAHKRREEEVCERETQEPLFNVYTYTVDQVAQDKRLKIETALRRANLHMTDYGRNIMANVPPPSQPRRDMQSTAFKSD